MIDLDPEQRALLRKVELVVCDVDGTLTDGKTTWLGPELGWTQTYRHRDGDAIRRLVAAGVPFVPLSRNATACARARMSGLGLETRWMGVTDKRPALAEILATLGVEPDRVLVMGDGAHDAELMPLVGVGVAVADAHPEAIRAARLVTKAGGGSGAVEELVIELLQARLCTTHALWSIDRAPVELPSALLDDYSRMKVGDQPATRALAERMVPRALELMAEAAELHWVLTSPPLHNIPCGANYLARHLLELLGPHTRSRSLSLYEIDRSTPETANLYRHAVNYANLGERERLAWCDANGASCFDSTRLERRAVLFVNDICVTGSKQHTLTASFEAAKPARIDWLYLLRVDPALARRDPQLEHRLNSRCWATLHELVALVIGDDVRYTGKCLATLLGYERAELEAVMPRLGPRRRAALHELATVEGCWSCEELWPKLELLGPRPGSP